MAIVHASFFSYALSRDASFTALLPNDGGLGREPFTGEMKTLYLLHGFGGNEWDYLANTRIRELSRRFGIAVIMPAGENSFYVDDPGAARNFGRYVGEELVEYTRRLFRLSARREDCYIGGLSMGGYGAVRNGLKYAGTFSKILSLSAAFIPVRILEQGRATTDAVTDAAFKRRLFGDPADLAAGDLEPRFLYRELKRKGGPLPRIFMTVGTEDHLLEENRFMRAFFQAEGADLVYTEDRGGHSWDFWNKRLPDAFAFLAEDERASPGPGIEAATEQKGFGE